MHAFRQKKKNALLGIIAHSRWCLGIASHLDIPVHDVDTMKMTHGGHRIAQIPRRRR